jgi:hypothetical protein
LFRDEVMGQLRNVSSLRLEELSARSNITVQFFIK